MTTISKDLSPKRRLLSEPTLRVVVLSIGLPFLVDIRPSRRPETLSGVGAHTRSQRSTNDEKRFRKRMSTLPELAIEHLANRPDLGQGFGCQILPRLDHPRFRRFD